jgi:hypothetical protein
LGLGLALSSINSNLKLNDFNNNIEGLIVAADSFDKNKWNTSSLEIPLKLDGEHLLPLLINFGEFIWD